MRLRGKIVRLVLNLATIHLPIYRIGQEPVPLPSNIDVFSNLPEKRVLENIAKAYCQIFSEPPWFETHTKERVIEKLSKEIENGRLVIMRKEGSEEIVGFCWGAVIPTYQIPERVARAPFYHNIKEGSKKAEGLLTFFSKEGQVLYLDELAVAKESRGGLAPIQFLLRPLLDFGWQKGAKRALFWTSDESKIKPLSLYMGFEPIYKIDKIVFITTPNILPLLKLAQCYEPNKISKIMRITSRIRAE